jgi:hypothetical protein
MKQSGSKDLKPILKWAGGKRQLIDHIIKKFPKSYNKFIEPLKESKLIEKMQNFQQDLKVLLENLDLHVIH